MKNKKKIVNLYIWTKRVVLTCASTNLTYQLAGVSRDSVVLFSQHWSEYCFKFYIKFCNIPFATTRNRRNVNTHTHIRCFVSPITKLLNAQQRYEMCFYLIFYLLSTKLNIRCVHTCLKLNKLVISSGFGVSVSVSLSPSLCVKLLRCFVS